MTIYIILLLAYVYADRIFSAARPALSRPSAAAMALAPRRGGEKGAASSEFRARISSRGVLGRLCLDILCNPLSRHPPRPLASRSRHQATGNETPGAPGNRHPGAL